MVGRWRVSPQSLAHTSLPQDSPSAPPMLTGSGCACQRLCSNALPWQWVFLPCVWTSSAGQCLELYKFTKINKSGESKADVHGYAKTFEKRILVWLFLPQALRNLLPVSLASPACSGVWSRADLFLQMHLTLLQPDRQSSPQGDGNNSRGDCPTWGAAPAALCIILALDLALRIHPLPLRGFADYPHASFSWRPFPNISQIPVWETSKWIHTWSMPAPTVSVPPWFSLISSCWWALSYWDTSCGSWSEVILFSQCKELCKCRTHQRMSRGQLALSWVNQSPCTFFFVVCVSFYHREGDFCSWSRGRLSIVLLVFA